MTIYAGAVGVTITLATGQDLTEATKLQINVLFPDGTTDEWAASESGTAGSIEYTTADGDLDQDGIYSLTAYIEWGALSAHFGEPCSLEVEPQQTVPTPDWSYEADFSTTRDQIRLRIGDIDSSDTLLTDAEIAQAYSVGGSVLQGAILAVRWGIAKLARSSYDRDIDGLSTKRSQRLSGLQMALSELQAEALASATTWTSPSVTRVTDTAHYPAVFQMTDTTAIEWPDEDDGTDRNDDYS